MARRPEGFASPDRFLIYAHNSPATFYPEEAHGQLQICLPAPGANYTVHRHSVIGTAAVKHLEGRDILVIPPGQPHAITWNKEAEIVSLLIETSFIDAALEGNSLDLRDGLTMRDGYLSATAQRIRDVLATGRANVTILEALTTTIVHGISEQAGRSRSLSQVEVPATPLSTRQLSILSQFVDEHLAEDLSVEILARQLDMSAWHFGRRLRAGTGLSPYSFLTDRRFAHAQNLLRSTSASVLDVAMAVGMTHSHFTRVFRRRLGVTPSGFRQETGWRR